MLPALVQEVVDDLLAGLDRAAPGRIEGFYIVGSASMGAFRAGRSDVDFVAIARSGFDPAELARLRAVHVRRWVAALIRDVALRWRWPLVCNGIYLRSGDLSRSPLGVTPLAASVAGRFRVADREGFDVNPVTWQMLAHHGVALRGPERERLQICTDQAELQTWTLSNLNGYWRRWTERAVGRLVTGVQPRRVAAHGVLSAPRLHYTLTTGAIASKETAALYALQVFEPRWHALIADALAFWRDEPPPHADRWHPLRHVAAAAEFVTSVIDAANQLTPRQ